jgi:DNA-binding LytR/AlgR family response regulator
MKVSIVIDKLCVEPYVEIHTSKVSDTITAAVQRLSEVPDEMVSALSAWKGDFVVLLKPCEIMRIYSGNKKVFAESESDIYELKYRLYEIEEIIKSDAFSKFIRISNAEIINYEFVSNFDMSLSGTICVNFKNKKRTFVSRRYVSKINEQLGLKH